jgi:UPF0271 protein
VAAAEGAALRHVKPHGALYHAAAADPEVAAAVARAVAAFDRSLVLVAPPRSELIGAARKLGLRTALEAFADRAYEPDGRLVPRGRTGAVIHDVGTVVARAVALATEHRVAAMDGSGLELDADTICLHGDTPGADRLAAAVRAGLEAAGVSVQPLGAG